MKRRARFEIIKSKASEGLDMLMDTLQVQQADYIDVLGRYWEAPSNPEEVPLDGHSEIFEPNLAADGCPSWREMGFQAMAIPFSFHVDRAQDYHRNYYAYSLGVAFLWSGVSDNDNELISLVSRWMKFDGVRWRDSGWRSFPAQSDCDGNLEFQIGIPLGPEADIEGEPVQ